MNHLITSILGFIIISSCIWVNTILCSPNLVSGKYFDRIITIVLENADYAGAIEDKYLSYLANQGILLTNFHGVWHPSQPNYIAMICGSTAGVLTNFLQDVYGPSLPELLEEKGISWKAYIENYPGDGFADEVSDDELYHRKHNPFISMANIRTNPSLVSKIVNADQLKYDLSSSSSDYDSTAIPQYIFYVPNVNNDGLNTNTSFSSNYLENHLMNLIKPILLTTKTLMLITYSESKDYFDFTNYNHIYAVLIGPNVLNPHRHKDDNRYDHYNILPTIQDNWNLSKLGTGEDLDLTPLDKTLFSRTID